MSEVRRKPFRLARHKHSHSTLQGQSQGMLYHAMYMYTRVVADKIKSLHSVRITEATAKIMHTVKPVCPFEPDPPPVGAACKVSSLPATRQPFVASIRAAVKTGRRSNVGATTDEGIKARRSNVFV